MVFGEHLPSKMFFSVLMLTLSAAAIWFSYSRSLSFAYLFICAISLTGTTALLLCFSGAVFLTCALLFLVLILVSVLVPLLLTRHNIRYNISNYQIIWEKISLKNG